MKKISVVMITYNHEKYIEQAIESVLIQEGNFELELLIGNDKSPDRTKEILKKYMNNERIKIYNREENLGAVKNLWDLCIKATGDYIAILEGDDFWTDKFKLSKQLELLEKNKEIILCYSDSNIVNENNDVVGIKKTQPSVIESLDSLLVNSYGIPTGTVMYRNIYRQNDIKNNKKICSLLKASEIIGDFSLFSYLISLGKFYKISEITGSYRFIENKKISTSFSSMSSIYKYKEILKVNKEVASFYNFNKIKKYFFTKRIEDKLIKNLKKENLNIEKELGRKLNFLDKIYFLLKPINNFMWSLKKKKYRR